MRGRRGRADRTIVIRLSVNEIGVLSDVLDQYAQHVHADADLFGDVWQSQYELGKVDVIHMVRHALQLAEDEGVRVGNSDEE